MSDLLSILNSPGVYDSARIASETRDLEKQKQQALIQTAMQKARMESEMQPYDIEYKKAMTQELLDRSMKYAQEKPYDQARASATRRESALPILGALESNPEAFFGYLNKIDPEGAAAIRASKDTANAIKTYLGEARSISKPYSSILNTKEKSNATRNVQEMKVEMDNRRLATMKEIANIRASNPTAAKNMSTSQLFAAVTKARLERGEITESEALEDIMAHAASSKLASPTSGVALTKTPEGKIILDNKNAPPAPSLPSANKAAIPQLPTKQEENDPLGLRKKK